MKHQVNIVAHRGASGTFPENTLSAFREAIRLNVESIEFDVHLSKDEELIIIHDDSVNRTTDGSGNIADLTLNEIKKLDASAGERIPILSETLEIMPASMRLNIHVKAYPATQNIVIQKVIDEMVQHDVLDNAFFTSDAEAVKLVKGINPDVTTCNLSGQGGNQYIELSKELGSYILQPGHQITTKEFVEEAHANNMEVNVFYADEEKDMLALIGMGVDGILTNYPERLKQLRGGEGRYV